MEVYLILFIAFILNNINSGQAFTYRQASFTSLKRGQRLKGYEFSVNKAKNSFACTKNCLMNPGCSAFSFNKKNDSCHLMKREDIDGTESDEHFSTSYVKLTCDDDLCLHSSKCYNVPTLSTNIVGYFCDCPCGRCGVNCNRLHFGHVTDACIYLFNAGYKKVESQAECMSFCWDTQGCRSADYISSQGACWLNSVTGDEEPLTMDCDKWYPGVAYLFFNCTCDI